MEQLTDSERKALCKALALYRQHLYNAERTSAVTGVSQGARIAAVESLQRKLRPIYHLAVG